MINLLHRLLSSRAPTIPALLWERAESQLPFLALLDPQQRDRLRTQARLFLAEKEFHAANGMELTDEIMLMIALQACLPILNQGLDAYRGWVGVIVYPGEILIPRQEMSEDGVVHEFEDSVLGEAWQDGPVLLSWTPEIQEEEGVNVVIHEFAHKLDMANGDADGFPALRRDMSRRAWADAFSQAYRDFQDRVVRLERDVPADASLPLDPYAAESPAEFFAVTSEAFFEAPDLLQDVYPAVYTQLALFYQLDLAPRARALFAGQG